MGGFSQIDEAARAGARASNADFAAPSGIAGINPLKIKSESLFIPMPLGKVFRSTATENPAGIFPGIVMPDSGASYFVGGLRAPLEEVVPGGRAQLHIFWWTTGATGAARFVVDIRPAIAGANNLSSAVQRAVISDADPDGSQIIKATVVLPLAVFSKRQLIGAKIARDPSNSLDTLGADLRVLGVFLEIPGRC